MTKRTSALVLLAVLAGCGPAPDPATAPRAVTPLGLEPPPIYSLLGFRQEIGLTSEQITRLDSIAEAVRQENAPLAQQLRERNPPRAQQRGLILVDSASQPLLNRLRENNLRAAEAVGELLTLEQKETACRLFDRRRDTAALRRQEADRARATQRRTPGGLSVDSILGLRPGSWIWCPSAADRAPASR